MSSHFTARMRIDRTELADLGTFLAIARHRSFRRVGLELGVSASALSHAPKAMEARLGVRLVNRTSRSVTLTAAGEDLVALLGAPFAAIGSALDVLNQHREPAKATGRIRLNVLEHASTLLLAPVLPLFHERHPQVEIDVRVSNDLLDVVEAGVDAGIRYGGTVPEEMVAQRLSGDLRWVVVGAPAYLDRHGTPDHPRDLSAHRCLRIRLGDDSLYRWEFEKAAETPAVRRRSTTRSSPSPSRWRAAQSPPTPHPSSQTAPSTTLRVQKANDAAAQPCQPLWVRDLVRWDQKDLSEASGVSLPTIKRLEAKRGDLGAHGPTIAAISRALETAGLEFIPENGGAGILFRERKDSAQGEH